MSTLFGVKRRLSEHFTLQVKIAQHVQVCSATLFFPKEAEEVPATFTEMALTSPQWKPMFLSNEVIERSPCIAGLVEICRTPPFGSDQLCPEKANFSESESVPLQKEIFQSHDWIKDGSASRRSQRHFLRVYKQLPEGHLVRRLDGSIYTLNVKVNANR